MSDFKDIGNNRSIEMFSEAKIELLREVNKHPDLRLQLAVEATGGDEGAVIGTIAAYCNVVMDGTYHREEIERLYPILVGKLQNMRKIIIH